MDSQTLSNQIARICEPYDRESYSDIDLNRLAVFAVHKLSDNGIVSTFESIVVALFRLFPEKFSLPGYPEFPDAARVNRALLQLRPKYRNWAIFSSAKGYILTELGHRVALQTTDLLDSPSRSHKSKRSVPSPPRTLYDGIARQIRRSTAFKKHLESQEDKVTRPEIFELLGAVPYTPQKLLRNKLHDWNQLAQQAGDREILEFLRWMKHRFSEIFSTQEEASS